MNNRSLLRFYITLHHFYKADVKPIRGSYPDTMGKYSIIINNFIYILSHFYREKVHSRVHSFFYSIQKNIFLTVAVFFRLCKSDDGDYNQSAIRVVINHPAGFHRFYIYFSSCKTDVKRKSDKPFSFNLLEMITLSRNKAGQSGGDRYDHVVR